MERAVLLIDGGYFDQVKRSFGIARIDYTKMGDELVQPCERFRSYYYHALPYVDHRNPEPADLQMRAERQRFFDGLSYLNRCEVKLGTLQRYMTFDQGGNRIVRHRQKLVDVLLSIDLVKLSWSRQIAMAVLLAGDSDFVPAVQAAKEAGVPIRLVFAERPGCFVHPQIKKVCDERVALTEAHMGRWALQGSTSV